MHESGRDPITEYYPSRTGAIGALLFFLVVVVLAGIPLFDGSADPLLWMLSGLALALCGFRIFALMSLLLRPRPTLVISDHGFTYRGYPHVAWTEVERLRVAIGRLGRAGREERFAEVELRDPAEFRDRVLALGSDRSRRHADRPLFIVPRRLPVPVPVVVEAMRRHHPDLVVGAYEDEPVPAPQRSPERDMVEAALVGALTELLPDGWQVAVLWFSLVGEDGHTGIRLQMSGDRPAQVEPTEEMLLLLGRLKDVCYDQMTGTWLSGQVVLRSDSTRAQFTLSFKEIPDWLPLPDPAECRRELATYPRAGDEIPEWLRLRIS